MSQTRRTEIVIETNRRLVIRWNGGATHGPPRSRHEKWDLHAEAFTALLARLDADWERAGEKYEAARRRLTKFFEWRGCQSAADLADETINRVARRIWEGEEIRAAEPMQYFYGVARNVLREDQDSRERQFIPLDELCPAEHPADDPWKISEIEQADRDRQRMLECLESCLKELPDAARKLLLEYHQGHKSARIEHRKEMAARMSITPNALKIRVHRIRESLERRVTGRLAGETDSDLSHSMMREAGGQP